MIEATTSNQAGGIAPQYRILSAVDAQMVWILKWSGTADHVIAHKLGTMPSRVSAILAENTHVGSRDQATKMVAQREREQA